MTRPRPSGFPSARASSRATAWARAFRRLAVGGLAALLLTAGGGPVAAADPLPPATAAVIDYQRVMREAKAAQSIRHQVEARRALYQEEIASEEQRLLEADRELARQRNILTAEAFAERRRSFEDDVARVQRFVQERRQQLGDVSAMALGEVREMVIQVVGELAEERGFNLVLPSAGVLLFSPQIEVTDEVLDRLDATLPDVRVPESSR